MALLREEALADLCAVTRASLTPRHDPLLHYTVAVARIQVTLALLPTSCVSQSKAMPEPPPQLLRTLHVFSDAWVMMPIRARRPVRTFVEH